MRLSVFAAIFAVFIATATPSPTDEKTPSAYVLGASGLVPRPGV